MRGLTDKELFDLVMESDIDYSSEDEENKNIGIRNFEKNWKILLPTPQQL